MKDIFIDSYGETNFEIVENSVALRSQIGVFLITDTDSLDYHTDYGLRYREILLNGAIDNVLKESHIRNQLVLYFNEFFRRPPVVKVTSRGRELNFEVKYFSIYGGEEVVTI